MWSKFACGILEDAIATLLSSIESSTLSFFACGHRFLGRLSLGLVDDEGGLGRSLLSRENA